MMETMVERDVVGKVVYDRDGSKLGKAKAVIGATTGDHEYLVVGRFLSRDLVIPLGVMTMSDGRLVVPRAGSFVNNSPEVGSTRVSEDEARRLELFYHLT